jgi:peroxiredoxin family protein
MIIAVGSASIGQEVTVFFTFWGLNALRKDHSAPIKKTAMEKMFSTMMPKGTSKLGLSRMNFGGIGKKMMIKKEELIDDLTYGGITSYASDSADAGLTLFI